MGEEGEFYRGPPDGPLRLVAGSLNTGERRAAVGIGIGMFTEGHLSSRKACARAVRLLGRAPG